MQKTLTAEQVCANLDISIFTLNNWYRFKRENPDDDLAKLLPDYSKEYETGKRAWKQRDLKKLMKFKETRNLGRNGQMSKTLQKYYKKEKEKDE